MADLPPADNGDGYSWLSPVEQVQFARLRVEKRRNDWLLGRWTAKRLVQTVVEQAVGEGPPLSTIVIERTANGAPRLNLDWAHPAWLKHLAVSVSHSGDRAFCAVAEHTQSSDQGLVLGADMEQCAVGSQAAAQLQRDYFTPEEGALVNRAPAYVRDRLVTAIWSAKEAALKALAVGLTVDTRAVSCQIQPLSAEPQFWIRFEIKWDPRWLKGGLKPLPERGWWRMMDDYVLTLVAGQTVIN